MNSLILRGIDGSNPLAYLAALGALRLADSGMKMRWVLDGVWRPELLANSELHEESLCELLLNAPGVPTHSFLGLPKNITVEPKVFRTFATGAAAEATLADRRAADFAASFGSEACIEEKKNRIQYTSLCFITGSGHQDFLETMKRLWEKAGREQLRRALFEKWDYSDAGLSMRWDPAEAREYALRWNDPGSEGAMTVWGANRLAIEALPLFPAQPARGGLSTTGFRRVKGGEEFTWPIWTQAAGCGTVGSLLVRKELQEENPDRRILAEIGVEEVYRAQRIRIGAGANFKVSFRPARSV
jgi:hypothetical protein